MSFDQSLRVALIGCLCACSAMVASAERTMRETVSLTSKSHPALATQMLEVERQSLSVKQVGTRFNPQVKFSAGIGKEESSNAATRARDGVDTATRSESALTMRQLLFDGNQSKGVLRAEEYLLDATKLERLDRRSEIVLAALEVHTELYRAQAFEAFASANVAAHQTIAESVRARVESGKDDNAKALQVEARLSLAQAEFASAKNETRAARAKYYARTGQGAKAVSIVHQYSLEPTQTLKRYEQAVLAESKSLAALVLREKAANASLSASKQSDLPRIYLESGASWNNNIDGVLGRSRDAYAMLRLDLDLYQGGAKKVARESDRVNRELIKLEREERTLQLTSEAAQLWHTYQAQRERFDFLRRYVSSAEATRDAYQKQFKIGRRTLVGLLDAETEVLSAHGQRLATQSSLLFTRFQMMHLRGQLLEEFGVEL